MRVIGFHSGHDCAYCVLENGVPIIHEEYERISRIKEGCGDALDFYFKRSHNADDCIFAHVEHHPGGVRSLYPESWERMMDQINSSENGGFYEPGHHQSHAANAFFTSDYKDSLIFTFDAGGWDDGKVMTTTVWRGKDNKITPVKKYTQHELNIGMLWHDMLIHVFGMSSGPPKGNQAGTLMAMASKGDPKKYYYLVKNSQFTDLKILHDSGEEFHIAAALQKVTEDIFRDLISFYLQPEDEYLCFAGGVALNSVALGKIYDWFPQVRGIFVPPAPYDGGLAIGAAQYVYHQILNNPRVLMQDNASAYLGMQYSEKDIKTALEKSDDISYEKSSLDDLISKLLDGKIVSIFSGRSESGRRALGNRSILADPRNDKMKDIINEKVKHREDFRPFAPSILREEVKNWFVKDVISDYMSVVIPFKEEVKDKIPAVVHFDGTGRLQTVTEKSNPWYYKFLVQWNKASGVPIILNTSFNDREPIVETPTDAINCYKKTNIDHLYFVDSNIMVSKK